MSKCHKWCFCLRFSNYSEFPNAHYKSFPSHLLDLIILILSFPKEFSFKAPHYATLLIILFQLHCLVFIKYFQMLEHVMKKQNSHAKRTRCGTEHNAYHANGCVMVILIVWMVRMRT